MKLISSRIFSICANSFKFETIGFSPNGFTGYFIFKILLVAFAGMVFIHAVAFFMRSFQELREGQASENKFKDLDELPDLTEVAKTNN